MELIITSKEDLAEVVKEAINSVLQNKPVELIKVDRHLSVQQLIDFLPEHPARQTIYGWVNNRKIPFKKIGTKLYFMQNEVQAWLDNGRQILLESKLKSI